jgi:hypothetical protein
MLLAGDGHQVIVLERDPEGPPADPLDAWERWQRPGLNQLRMAHTFLGGFRAVLDAELPGVSKALQDAGGLRLNFIRDVLPAEMSGGWRDGDERYQWLTGRRVVVEAVQAAAAESTPGVEIRRGTTVAGRTTLTSDRHRLGEIEAGIRGVAYDSPDPRYELEKALDAAFGRDPECTRANFDIKFVLRTPEEVFARPGLRDKTLQQGSGWRDARPFGPTREQLLALVSA